MQVKMIEDTCKTGRSGERRFQSKQQYWYKDIMDMMANNKNNGQYLIGYCWTTIDNEYNLRMAFGFQWPIHVMSIVISGEYVTN